MSDVITEYCYEYFNCKELDCSRRKNLQMNCWEVDDVHCKSHSENFERLKARFDNKLEACKLCYYYQKHHNL
jgi:hypothetical protein